MNDLILSKLREGDWGAFLRLVREELQEAPPQTKQHATPQADSARPLPFKDRFDTVRITPRQVSDDVIEENGRLAGIEVEGERYSPSQRFLKGLAQRMRVPLGVFELFTPLEVIRRAAERAPDLPLRVTLDHEAHEALALVEDKGVPLPAGNIEIIMREDKRLQDFKYKDGVITGRFDLGESWDIRGDSTYGVHVSTDVPIDGMGSPVATLETWRQVCSNGAVAEAPLFRTKMEVKDSSGDHFRRLLKSFSNPHGIEMLHERLIAANGTRASVQDVHLVESFIAGRCGTPATRCFFASACMKWRTTPACAMASPILGRLASVAADCCRRAPRWPT